MKVHTATFLASSISGLSLLACLIVISNIYSDVQSIWNELDMEIGTFRSTTDDLWRDMMRLGSTKRFRRQA
ncbi:nematode cuticle collagen domain-containing protein, partial [Aphelenchoides avenae]